MKSGVYKITNIVNNKIYIGSSYHIKDRISSHKGELRRNTHHSRYLQNAWNKYGEDRFVFETIVNCPVEELIITEQYLIDFYKPAYNMSPTAGNCRGVKHTDETRRNMSIAHIGYKVREETKEKLRKHFDKRPNTWQARPIEQIDLNTLQVLNTFISVAQASIQTGLTESSIAKCARGVQKSAHGYLWRYV